MYLANGQNPGHRNSTETTRSDVSRMGEKELSISPTQNEYHLSVDKGTFWGDMDSYLSLQSKSSLPRVRRAPSLCLYHLSHKPALQFSLDLEYFTEGRRQQDLNILFLCYSGFLHGRYSVAPSLEIMRDCQD